MSYYGYHELKTAVKTDATQENVNALGEWFACFGGRYWNGEFYNADDCCIYPVYEEIGEDEFELIGYELR